MTVLAHISWRISVLYGMDRVKKAYTYTLNLKLLVFSTVYL